jgi:hypothetical protein
LAWIGSGVSKTWAIATTVNFGGKRESRDRSDVLELFQVPASDPRLVLSRVYRPRNFGRREFGYVLMYEA